MSRVSEVFIKFLFHINILKRENGNSEVSILAHLMASDLTKDKEKISKRENINPRE